MIFKSQPKYFDTTGKDALQIVIEEIDSFDEEPYTIAAGSYGDEAGYSVTIWGVTNRYWRNEDIVRKELRLSIKIFSDSGRHQLERGVIGGAVFGSNEYLEVGLNVEPRCVKDIVEELRRDKKRSIRIDGYAINDKTLRIAYFLLFPSGK